MWTILYVGDPETPGNLEILTVTPISVVWSKPTNIPEEVFVGYRITISSDSGLSTSRVVTNQTRLSLQSLDLELADFGECVPVTFSVVATAPGTEDSVAAILMDTLPLCECQIYVVTI